MKFAVLVPEVHYVRVVVEAESKKGAIEKAKKAIHSVLEQGIEGCFDMEYSHTLEEDRWRFDERVGMHEIPWEEDE